MLNLLVISDEAKELYALFKAAGFLPDTQDARNKGGTSDTDDYAMAFLDLDLADWERRLLELRQRMPVIAFARPDIRVAVEAMRLGASDFVGKPLTGDLLSEIIDRHKKRMLTRLSGFDEITGASGPMQEVFGLIKRAAASESNVLITGESGTGKELIARAIHRWSPRSEKSFITINCSAIPDTLLESELFGFEKGAFTGANYTKKGLLETADRGTVFFDEIGDVSPLFQIKVLRVLQEGEIMRVGGMRHLNVDVRIIAATNRDLKSACTKGAFREDLYYRLNVINIHLPPLRERIEDVPLLVRHFIKKHAAKRKDIHIKGITDDALAILKGHSYPGNVRELENVVEHAISFANSPEILPSDLPSHILQSPVKREVATPRLRDALRGLERETIISALNDCDGNISRAATVLGIYRQQLQRKIRTLKIAT